MEEAIDVEQGQWKVAVAPNWLTTAGLGPCIAVIILNHTQKKAWLSHEPGISSTNGDDLRAMIADATNAQEENDKIELHVLGGDISDSSVEEQVLSDRKFVQKTLKRNFSVPIHVKWSEVEFVEVIFSDTKWEVRTGFGN